MSENQGKKDPLQIALDKLTDSSAIIAAELRLMASGEDRYEEFSSLSPWIKAIWNEAADLLDKSDLKKRMN